MTAYFDLVVVLALLTLVAGTPPAAAVIVLTLTIRTRSRSRRPGVVASPSGPPTDVIDDFLQYSYGPWSYFHAGELLMRAPRDEDGHVLLAQAHPVRLEWCDDVTPVEILHILRSLEAHDRTQARHGQALR